MPLFVVSWMDKPGGLPVRMAAREAHLDYVRQTGAVRLGGPFLDENGGMAGSLIIIEADSLEAAQAWHAADPYKTAGVFETSDVKPWRITVGSIA